MQTFGRGRPIPSRKGGSGLPRPTRHPPKNRLSRVTGGEFEIRLRESCRSRLAGVSCICFIRVTDWHTVRIVSAASTLLAPGASRHKTGDCSSGNYWSSTENSSNANNAWNYNFNNSNWNNNNKTNSNNVRACFAYQTDAINNI